MILVRWTGLRCDVPHSWPYSACRARPSAVSGDPWAQASCRTLWHTQGIGLWDAMGWYVAQETRAGERRRTTS